MAAPLASIIHRDEAQGTGKKLTRKLKELIPRQQFKVPIQAAIGQKIVASSAISPIRKDVLAKCYGGDISRKKKLLQKRQLNSGSCSNSEAAGQRRTAAEAAARQRARQWQRRSQLLSSRAEAATAAVRHFGLFIFD